MYIKISRHRATTNKIMSKLGVCIFLVLLRATVIACNNVGRITIDMMRTSNHNSIMDNTSNIMRNVNGRNINISLNINGL